MYMGEGTINDYGTVPQCYMFPQTHITSDMCSPGGETHSTEAGLKLCIQAL